MLVENQQIMKAFEIYIELSQKGEGASEMLHEYNADDLIRGLVDQFAAKVDCVIITAGERMFLIPETKLSPFHVKNDWLKRTFLGTKAKNSDLYLMYFSMIVFFGTFYDSYQTTEVTRDFLPVSEWIEAIEERVQALKEHDEDLLKSEEKELEISWSTIIDKWDALDDIKETAKRQSGNTISRVSFLDSVQRFLLTQQLAKTIGNQELELTEKSKTIVQRYYMDLEYNRGIIDFMYQSEQERKGKTNASHL